MRKAILGLFLLSVLVMPVFSMDYTAPSAPQEVQDLVPYQPESFGEGLWKVIKGGIGLALPDLVKVASVCLSVIACFMLISVLKGFTGDGFPAPEWAVVILVTAILFTQTKSMIGAGIDAVQSMSEYGKLLLPVMTAALAAQGGVTASGGLYIGTAVFDTVLSGAVASFFTPLMYVFLALSFASAATGERILEKGKEFVGRAMAWSLRTALYVFTGYMTITGVVSGSADQTVVKATKLTISGMVPVVGGILSDASEAVVVGAGVMKNAAGVYGLLAIIAIWITPFCRIGMHYFILKVTASFCEGFGIKKASALVNDFSDLMGLLLAMTGTSCVFLLISVVCFMKGMG